MEAVKAPEGPHEDLFVADALLRPTLQYLIKTKSFGAMKFVIFQIGVVNDFGQAKHGSFTNTETFNQRLERAAIAMRTKLRVYHVIGESSGM